MINSIFIILFNSKPNDDRAGMILWRVLCTKTAAYHQRPSSSDLDLDFRLRLILFDPYIECTIIIENIIYKTVTIHKKLDI